jgi:5-methylcytosine-specific restriction endonuclease McrA
MPTIKKPKQLKQPSEAVLKHLRAKAVFTRDGFQCLKCGRNDTLAPSHIYPQGRYQRMKWLMINIITLCYGCHFHFWHKHPLAASEWIKKTLPKSRLDYLRKLANDNNLPKPNLAQVKIVYEEFIKGKI